MRSKVCSPVVFLVSVSLVSLSLAGCLQTRRELRGDAPSSQQAQRAQVEMQQQEQIPRSSYSESGYDDQLKELRGRLDQLEYQNSQIQAGAAASESQKIQQQQDLQTRFHAYEQALKNLEIQILGLVKDFDDLKKKKSSRSSR